MRTRKFPTSPRDRGLSSLALDSVLHDLFSEWSSIPGRAFRNKHYFPLLRWHTGQRADVLHAGHTGSRHRAVQYSLGAYNVTVTLQRRDERAVTGERGVAQLRAGHSYHQRHGPVQATYNGLNLNPFWITSTAKSAIH